MTEDDGKFEEWMYGFAWKGRDAALHGLNILENKAMSIINISSVVITLLTGVLFFIKDSQIDATMSIKASDFIIWAIILLIISIIFSFLTIRIRKHGMIPINKHFEDIDKAIDQTDKTEVQIAMGKTAKTIGDWQWKLIELNKAKSRDFAISSGFFVLALILILFSSLLISSYI